MMIKYGELTEDSFADLSPKKVKYIEKNGFALADEDSKDELENPVKIKFSNKNKFRSNTKDSLLNLILSWFF